MDLMLAVLPTCLRIEVTEDGAGFKPAIVREKS